MTYIYEKIKTAVQKNIYLHVLTKNISEYFIYFIDKISNYRITKRKFFKILKYPLNLKNPKTFNEKMFWKKIYDRNPLLPKTSNKYEVRSYVKELLGEEKANEILIPLFYVTDRPDTIPFQEINPPFIIKPNHSSGKYIIVKGNNSYLKLNREETIKKCWDWLKIPYGITKHEWAYQPIRRKIIIEKLLLDEEGKIPKDYKFFVIHGICRKILVFSNRQSEHPGGRKVTFYDRNWELIPRKNDNGGNSINEKPDNCLELLEIAEKLGKDFDFVRVDLYSIFGKIYFGELTHYPMSGFCFKRSLKEDIEMGNYWDIKRNKCWNGC